jgi:UTP--glucose-1-phosphate uridylyltransferase
MIKKVVIPVAGLGTRFLPATKAQPKEMLPILDKPIIQYIVEGVVEAGVRDVILVTGATKRAIEDHFDRNETLEQLLKKSGKHGLSEHIKRLALMANFIYIRQKGPYGNGTPILNAAEVVGDEPFGVVWGDEIWRCPRKPHLTQLMDVYTRYGDPVLSVQKTDAEGTKKYGIIEGTEVEPGIWQVKRILEKPGPTKTKSRIAIVSGQILTPDIFPLLRNTKRGIHGEVWLTDAISALAKKRPVYAKTIDGTPFDAGSKLGWLKANIEFGLNDPDIRAELKAFLRRS